eukprot:SAG25_NODE_913_length_4784_cov_7.021345_5_plen_175_part_00
MQPTTITWSWWAEGQAGRAFPPDEAATIEDAYLRHLFWGEDLQQKAKTCWVKLSGSRIIDFVRMRQVREDVPERAHAALKRDATTDGRGAVTSLGKQGATQLMICTVTAAAVDVTDAAPQLVAPPALCQACLDGDARAVRDTLLQLPDLANAMVDQESQATGENLPTLSRTRRV